ncbi:CLUMA_CG006586, isoform A [Clunio marinus]|uniref:CLUMA_CG006586, isoform A n=1 Tax=Clunio marinus TaxID=568069 RepID=A0A1J1HZP0_9DIPT|nr:CLUMA_CG006586, isoform A [Clunio marinus]
MFNNLKNKIKTETGQDPTHRLPRHSTSNRNSLSIDELSRIEEKDAEIVSLKEELIKARSIIVNLESEKKSLEDSKKANQIQKEIFYDETDKIQDIQHQEILKLKSLLLFREQESLDYLNKAKNDNAQIQSLKSEIQHLSRIESSYENIKDELEHLRRTSQMEKNQLTTQLSAKKEEIRQLANKLEISEQSRALFSSADSENDTIKLLLQERNFLENRLEEANVQLIDIKTSWANQNMSLEDQLQRLSRQVAEETAEKRKAYELKEKMIEKIEQLEFDLMKTKDELKLRDNKIKLLNEEIVELNSSLHDLRLENEEEIEFLRYKFANQESESKFSKENIEVAETKELEAEERFQRSENNEIKVIRASELQEKKIIHKCFFEDRKECQDQIKRFDLKFKEMNEYLNEKLMKIQEKEKIIEDLHKTIDKYESDINDQTRAIKILNQRLFDVKKTLQEEIRNKNNGPSGSISSNAPAILVPINVDNNISYHNIGVSGKIYEMDEVKFSYLKHVILKFLTSRDLEARHLIRAISTLLCLDDSEEKLLAETLEYKRGWFGIRTDSSFR